MYSNNYYTSQEQNDQQISQQVNEQTNQQVNEQTNHEQEQKKINSDHDGDQGVDSSQQGAKQQKQKRRQQHLIQHHKQQTIKTITFPIMSGKELYHTDDLFRQVVQDLMMTEGWVNAEIMITYQNGNLNGCVQVVGEWLGLWDNDMSVIPDSSVPKGHFLIETYMINGVLDGNYTFLCYNEQSKIEQIVQMYYISGTVAIRLEIWDQDMVLELNKMLNLPICYDSDIDTLLQQHPSLSYGNTDWTEKIKTATGLCQQVNFNKHTVSLHSLSS